MTVYSEALELIQSERWAALATIHEGHPLASSVAYVVEPGSAGLLFHLSQMAAHTEALLANPSASLVVSRPDTGQGDPQLLPRLTLNGTVEALDPSSEEYAAARRLYITRLPGAAERFELGDFILFRFTIETARYVGGFGRAARMTGEQLKAAARNS
ncbi:MAG: pyridoxamine 5'-phosphate oxidase family protein [Acidobacteria bacterium]|nr:pyridoxamine 5'-phosphate oxidase family protein [Acidobacteriota bacterium]MCG3194810.1 hypothetical protein [Thermoanaerobaculia bacterium]MCK6685285.1 CREG family protein [Thermoanaerobaculia bacterium]